MKSDSVPILINHTENSLTKFEVWFKKDFLKTAKELRRLENGKSS